MAVSYVTLYLPDGTPVQVVEGGPLHKLYVARGANGAPPTPGPVVRLDPFPQYVDQDELTQALGGVGASDTAVAALVNDTGSQTRGALGAALVPFWAPAETVTAGKVRMAPDGHIIVRNADGTTRASYDATEQGLWTVVSGGGGAYTDEQVRDVIAAALVAGAGITVTPNDGADTITITATGGGGGGGAGVPGTFLPASNDAAGIQAAIDAASAAGGGTVWLADSTINTTTVYMRDNVTVRGHGPNTTITGSASPVFGTAPGAAPDRYELRDLTIQGCPGRAVDFTSNAGIASYQLGWPRVTIENITVADPGGDGIRVFGDLIESRIVNCVVLRGGGRGIFVDATDVLVYGCTAAECVGDGIHIAGANTKVSTCKGYGNDGKGFAVMGAGRHILSSCEAQDNVGPGFHVDGQWNALSACLADSNGPSGFLVTGSNNTLQACSGMFGSGGSGQQTPIGFDLSGSNLVVSGVSVCLTPVRDTGTNNSVDVKNPPPPPASGFTDDFNRANGPLGNGWTHSESSNIAINGNKVTGSADWSKDSYAFRNCNSPDGTIAATLNGTNAETQGLVLRYVDNQNMILINRGQVWERVDGVETALDPATFNTTNARVEVTAVGSAITVKVDGAQVVTVTSSAHETSTLHGLAAWHNLGSVDDWSYTPPA